MSAALQVEGEAPCKGRQPVWRGTMPCHQTCFPEALDAVHFPAQLIAAEIISNTAS